MRARKALRRAVLRGDRRTICIIVTQAMARDCARLIVNAVLHRGRWVRRRSPFRGRGKNLRRLAARSPVT